ncbi:MAG: deoxyguanosinetriphosphate triphosphohydrolase [Chloroflexi bacterium]|nr:deoxyguanosinetriphosphate triphosphohydrolase [Chloroflexota bacterium]
MQTSPLAPLRVRRGESLPSTQKLGTRVRSNNVTVEKLQIRQKAEAREESLSPFAAKSALSRGRDKAEEPCTVRTAFQRDRDRIIYSNSFRRLKHKTQVFIAPQGDHYVTRLTHTLEVSQIARTIARALNLNEDLTEAISLGHDLGHTPFGHVGEEVLNELYLPGFRHNEQSLRIVEVLENNGQGLNLTWEVRDGILNHSKTGEKIIKGGGQASTLEGSIARIADVVAYVNHDIDDAIRAGNITEDDLPVPATTVLGHSNRERINTLVCDIIEQSWTVAQSLPRTRYGASVPVRRPTIQIYHTDSIGTKKHEITPHPNPLPQGEGGRYFVTMSPKALKATNTLRDFLFEHVYNREATRKETEKAREIVRQLYAYFNKHEDKLPPEFRPALSLPNGRGVDERERCVVDYIAGMTDQYATKMAGEISAEDGIK